jgi:hypothetical protein
MKSFLGGLALATGMALLNGASASPPAVCLVLPSFESFAAVELRDDDCSSACARGSRNSSGSKGSGTRNPN